jgi:molecular chaperone GrpE
MEKNKEPQDKKQEEKNPEKVQDENKEKIEELTNDLKRMGAEFDNYRKRTEKEMSDFRGIANANLISDILPVIDSLEQGIKHSKEFVPIYEQLYGVLKRVGLEKVEVNVGDEFDHDRMECLMKEENKELKEGVVANILSSGYKLNGKILRTAKISINDLKKEDK